MRIGKRSIVIALLVIIVHLGSAVAFVPCDADLNGDGSVNLPDVGLFASDYFSSVYVARSDFNNDGALGLADVHLLATALGTTGCP